MLCLSSCLSTTATITPVHFADRLTERVRSTSPLCVGLDPISVKLPRSLRPSSGADRASQAAAIEVFCRGIIDVATDSAACVKPNLAFFEVLGWEGVRAFEKTCAYAASRGLLVIADGKRGDIGSTAEAYAEAYLTEGSSIDAVTVHPYLGSDGVRPFIERAAASEKGVFVLVKTSNPSSGELQDLPTGDEAVHEHLAQLVESWGAEHLGSSTYFSCVGAVVGATYPEELSYLRTLMPHCIFLIPGVGAQGGSVEDTVRGFLPNGTGAVVSVSRSILYASEGDNWQDRAHSEMQSLAGELWKALAP